MASTKCFVELDPYIQRALGIPLNVKTLQKHIKDYLGENSEILSSPSLNEKPTFSRGEDQEIMFTCLGITRAQIADILKRTGNRDVKAGWKVWNSEQYLAFTMAIRYFTKKHNEEMIKLLRLYFAVMLYSFMYRKYFEYGVKKEVMEYTIGGLSNKFDLKRLGSLILVLEKIAEGNHENAKSRLIKDTDDDIFVYPRDFRTRMNTFVQNIAVEYYKNYDEGNYLNTDKAQEEGENGEEYQTSRGSDSGAIYEAAETFEIWFMTNRLNERLVRTVSNMSPEISPAKLSSILNSIKTDKQGRLNRTVRAMLGLLMESQKDNSLKAIHSKAFPLFCIRILSKSNTKNDNILTTKENINSMLNDFSETYRKTKREASRINYRKALIMYLAMGLQIQRK